MAIKWLTDTIYVAASTIDKWGIFTSIPISAGETIYQVTGQIVTAAFSEEFAKMGPNWIGVRKEVWLSPDLTNPMNFMNHSCEPNSIVSNGLRVIALKSIQVHEEIVMDYSTTEIDPYWSMPCTCNRPTCRKLIQPYQFLPIDLRYKYRCYMLDTLLADVMSEKALATRQAVRYG